MNFKLKLLGTACAVAAAAGITAGVASAATTGSGKVWVFGISGTQYAVFGVENTPTGTRPSCHNGWFSTHYAFDVSTNKGKALLSTVQAVWLSGKSLTVTGGSTCTNAGGSWGNLETSQAVMIVN